MFLEGGKVHLKSLDPIELPQRVKRLKERVADSWPQIRIQDLLVEVDTWTNFNRVSIALFTATWSGPLNGSSPHNLDAPS